MNDSLSMFKPDPLMCALRSSLSLSVLSKVCLLAAAGFGTSAGAQSFPAQLNLSDLDGSNGFVINGIDLNDNSGHSVSGAGDINGDGVDDLIIGAPNAQANGISGSGESYVVFGGIGVGAGGVIELSTLNGSDGFVLNGIDVADRSGTSVSGAGDLNGDGVDDLIIAAPTAAVNGISERGESYVVFGGVGVGAGGVIELSTLNGSDGFVLNGIDAGDRSGTSVSRAGDINGDGFDDLIIGALFGDENPNGFFNIGESYVVFGGTGVGAGGVIELSALNGSNGFDINGVDSDDQSGVSVSAAGDINGDGLDDLIIGAHLADHNGNFAPGESYVVFGGGGVGAGGEIELADLDGSNGFVLNGIDADDRSGYSVSGAGDLNRDGIDDLIIGAELADPNGTLSGESYVVFGGIGVGAGGVIELVDLDGSDGFMLNGIDSADRSGVSVSGAGDFNDDGVDDIVIGAWAADPNGNTSGETYVVFGRVGIGAGGTIEFADLDGSDGVVINGINNGDRSGSSVSGAGDINGDGVDDLIIGAPAGDPNSSFNSGETYVVFGIDVAQCNGLAITVDLNLGQTPGPNSDVIRGTPGNDVIRGRAGDDTICGEGGNDFIHGNSGNDWIDGGDGVDELRGGQGDDVIFTGSGATVSSNSIVFGGTGDDEINGGPDADDLRGGRGVDTINGQGGIDEISGNSDDDMLFGGVGDDELRGGQGDDLLSGEAGDDFLSGGGGSLDVCDGGAGTGDVALASCESVSNVP